MIHLVLRNLIYERGRTAMTGLAIASVVALILVLEGLNEGLLAQLRAVANQRGADLIVTQRGVAHMTAARSVLRQSAREQVEAVAGVRAAEPLTGIPVIFDDNGLRTPVFVLVYDVVGGPDTLIEGHLPRLAEEMVIDRSLAQKYDLSPGDRFVIADFAFTVSGVTEGAVAFFTPFAFIRFDGLIDFYFASDLAADITTFPLLSFLLVQVEDGVDPLVVRRDLSRAIPDIDVHFPSALGSKDAQLGAVLFGSVFTMLIAVAYLVGLVATAIVAYAAVNARRPELALLKALGYRNRTLMGAVAFQCLLMTAVALPIGAVAAGLASFGIAWAMPLYEIAPYTDGTLARTTAASLVFTLTGAALGMRHVQSVDPALTFRGRR